MRKKVYHLSNCGTCQRIIQDLGIGQEFDYQDIKTEPITESQLNEMAQIAGNYEALFSRVARKYKALNLKDVALTEADYKRYILEEYTFLKRPVFLVGDKIFVGNSPKNISALAETLRADNS